MSWMQIVTFEPGPRDISEQAYGARLSTSPTCGRGRALLAFAWATGSGFSCAFLSPSSFSPESCLSTVVVQPAGGRTPGSSKAASPNSRLLRDDKACKARHKSSPLPNWPCSQECTVHMYRTRLRRASGGDELHAMSSRAVDVSEIPSSLSLPP